MSKLIIGSLAAIVFLSGCAVSVDRYQSSPSIQANLRSLDVEMDVGHFTSDVKKGKTLCRLANNVKMRDNMLFSQYIESALVDELQLAGVYKEGSSVKIDGHLNEVDSSASIGDSAHWTFDVTISNGRGDSFNIRHKKTYSASFIGGLACGTNMPKAFMPSVQDLIIEIINHPSFVTMFR